MYGIQITFDPKQIEAVHNLINSIGEKIEKRYDRKLKKLENQVESLLCQAKNFEKDIEVLEGHILATRQKLSHHLEL